MNTRSAAAHVACVIAAAIFGGSTVATRAVGKELPPISLAVLRYAQGGLILALCLLIVGRQLLRVRRRDLPFIALLGLILFAAFPLSFNASLRLTEASRGSLMLATAPILTAMLARATLHERLRGRQMGGLVLTVAGVALVIAERGIHWQANGRALAGDGLMLITACCGALYSVLAKRIIGRYSALTITTWTMLCGALALLPAALIDGLPGTFGRLHWKTLALVLFLGIVGGAIGWYLFTFALGRLSPTQAGVYVNLNPMVATALGALLLGERLTVVFVIGFVIVLTGVLLVNLPPRRAAVPSADDLLPALQNP